MNNLQHFTALKTLNVSYDIVGMNGSANVYGSALFYNNNDNIGKYTGFGLFKDNVGNLIVVCDESMEQSRELLKGGLFGFQSTKEIYNDCPVIYLGEDYKNIFGTKSTSPGERAKLFRDGYVNQYYGNWQGAKPTQKNFYEVLTNIESKGTIFSEPIFIIRTYKENSLGLSDILGYALSTASVFVPMIKIDPKVFKMAGEIIKLWKADKPIDRIDDIFNVFASTTELLVPEWTKGAKAVITTYKNEYKEVKEKINFGQYVVKAKAGFEAIRNNSDLVYINELAKNTGINPKQLQSFTHNIQQGNLSQVVNLTEINNGYSLINANKILANVNATFTNEILKRAMQEGGNLLSELKGSLSINSIPAINNLFQSGSASTILQGLPNVNNLITEIIKVEKYSGSLKNNYFNSLAGLIGANFGYVGPEENFDTFTLNALKFQATDYAVKNIPFVLPDTIPASKREMFAMEIQKSTGAKVIGYEEGWDWNTTLKKMAPLGIAVVVGGILLKNSKKKTINKKVKV